MGEMLKWYTKRKMKKEMQERSQKVTYGNVIRSITNQPPATPVVRRTPPIQAAVTVNSSESSCSICTFDLPGVVSASEDVSRIPVPRHRARLHTWPENRSAEEFIK